MAWYSDEQWDYMQDCKDKSITARSARKTRSHCGKGGSVKLPSDYMSKKELKSMNGECKSYRLNSPMSWEEFKSMPEDLKFVYIQALRKKYNVPNTALAEMFGISGPVLSRYLYKLGLGVGKSAASSKKTWEKDAFLIWRNGVKLEETKVEESEEETPMVETDISETEEEPEIIIGEAAAQEAIEEGEEVDAILKFASKIVDIHEDLNALKPAEPILDPVICTYHRLPVIPKSGTMSFNGNFADDALDTIKTILSNARVNLTISWECMFEE